MEESNLMRWPTDKEREEMEVVICLKSCKMANAEREPVPGVLGRSTTPEAESFLVR